MSSTVDVPAAVQGNLLTFGSDVPLRNRLFVRASFSHPAKLHLGLLSTSVAGSGFAAVWVAVESVRGNWKIRR